MDKKFCSTLHEIMTLRKGVSRNEVSLDKKERIVKN